MSVDTHVSCGTAQTLPFPIRDMLFGLWIPILLRHSEIDHMDRVGAFRPGASDQEIIRFDISIDEILFVNSLDARKLLLLALW